MALSATFSRFLVHAANAPLGEPNHGQTAHAILCNVVRAIFARGEEKFGSIETAFLCALGEYIARAEVTVAEYFTRWFLRRTKGQGKRVRRIMIVALARKLAIALWRYLEQGLVPEGAVLGGK